MGSTRPLKLQAQRLHRKRQEIGLTTAVEAQARPFDPTHRPEHLQAFVVLAQLGIDCAADGLGRRTVCMCILASTIAGWRGRRGREFLISARGARVGSLDGKDFG
jgi:hypothetical protein